MRQRDRFSAVAPSRPSTQALEMIKPLTFTLILAFFFIKPSFAAEEGESLIKEIQQNYQELENFSCAGNIQITHFVNDFATYKYQIDFTIKLKKPDHFLIHWKRDEVKDSSMQIEGAIWSEAGKAFYYQKDTESYFELAGPEQAFSIATGGSLGIAYKIPSLFFESYFKNNWLSSFKEPNVRIYNDNSLKMVGVIIDSESIEKYEIDIAKDQNFIKRHWSKSTQPDSNKKRVEELIKRRKEIEEDKTKYEEIFAELDDSENKVTVESILRNFDERIERLSKLPDNKHMAHSLVNETFENISTNNLKLEDFKFQVPPGVEFKGSKLQQIFKKAK